MEQTSEQTLRQTLQNWVAMKEENGISQRTPEWLKAKTYTIGGSSLAVIQGNNPYSTIPKLVREKIGLSSFTPSLAVYWGNLFEDVIQRVVECDRNCKVIGENLYVDGVEGIAYSPDGLAVMQAPVGFRDKTSGFTTGDEVESTEMADEIVLVEFKCPFSRIPTNKPPGYYVSQVKMGLDVLELPTVGVLIEGVFRRCTWDQLDESKTCDKTLAMRTPNKLPTKYGIIGLYYDEDSYQRHLLTLDTTAAEELEQFKEKLWDNYYKFFAIWGDKSNDYCCNDLGLTSKVLFSDIMEAFNRKILCQWYGGVIPINTGADKLDTAPLNSDLAALTQVCADGDFINFGIIPWKLFSMHYHFLHKEENYLAEWIPKITEILTFVKKCNDPANAEFKHNMYDSFVDQELGVGFS